MITHMELGELAITRHRKLLQLIDQNLVQFAGNRNLKIYGTLQCKSGKRMKLANRVFFASENEALTLGYRPCGHCLRNDYLNWKK